MSECNVTRKLTNKKKSHSKLQNKSTMFCEFEVYKNEFYSSIMHSLHTLKIREKESDYVRVCLLVYDTSRQGHN